MSMAPRGGLFHPSQLEAGFVLGGGCTNPPRRWDEAAPPPSVAIKLLEMRLLDPVDEDGNDWGEVLLLYCTATRLRTGAGGTAVE